MKRDNVRIVLAWIEAPIRGTAPGHHLRGTLKRLMAWGVVRDRVRVAASEHPRRYIRIAVAIWRATRFAVTADVLVARWHPLMLPISFVARLARTPVVLLVQGSIGDVRDAHPLAKAVPGLQLLVNSSLRLASVIVVPHAGWRGEVSAAARRAPEEILVLPNGYPLASSAEPSALTDTQLPERYAIFAGTLAVWQGIETMLEAIEHPDWPEGVDLVVVGDGAEARTLETAKSPRVHYLGRLPTKDVHALIRRSVCSLSPKLLTGATAGGLSPFKLLEAGQNGRPIVASAITGQVEHVRSFDCGLLVNPGSASDLAQAVSRLADDSTLADRLGANGQSAARHFSWESGADTLGIAISQALGPNRAGVATS